MCHAEGCAGEKWNASHLRCPMQSFNCPANIGPLPVPGINHPPAKYIFINSEISPRMLHRKAAAMGVIKERICVHGRNAKKSTGSVRERRTCNSRPLPPQAGGTLCCPSLRSHPRKSSRPAPRCAPAPAIQVHIQTVG